MRLNRIHSLLHPGTSLLCLTLLAACGQSGPLYLPDSDTGANAAAQTAGENPQPPDGEPGAEPVLDGTSGPAPDPADPENDDLP